MKKGVALIWVLVLSTVLLLMTNMMVDIIVKESRFGSNIVDSTRAYLAAESGITWGKDYLKTYIANPSANAFDIKVDNISVHVTYQQLPEGGYLIGSNADSNGVNRKIEYRVKSYSPALAPCVNTAPVHLDLSDLNLSGSFDTAFNYSTESSSVATNLSLLDASQNGFVLNYDPPLNQISLKLKNGENLHGVGAVYTIDSTRANDIENTNNVIRVRLKYLENISMGIYFELQQDDGTWKCLNSSVFSLSNQTYSVGKLVSASFASTKCSLGTSNSIEPNDSPYPVIYNFYRRDN